MRSLVLLLLLINVAYFAWAKSKVYSWDAESSAVEGAAQIDSELPRLRLLAELPIAERQQVNGVSLPPAEVVRGEADSRCWVVGPMPEVVTAKQVLLRFHKLDLPARLVETEIKAGESYRVYLGPFSTEGEALVKLSGVHAAGLDGFLITGGSLAGGIALGDYEDLDLASSAISELEAHGFNGNYQQISNLITQQWVVVTLQESSGLVEDDFWVELDRDFNKLVRKQTWCGAIASAGHME